MYPHRIRLRGPWQWEPLAGVVRYRRRFGYPGRIDDYERVWLTFADVRGSAELQINGYPLGRFDTAQAEFEVTRLLQARNELLVDVETPYTAGGAFGEVALEVRCSAYLRNVRFEMVREGESDRLQISGEVVGTCERPLELYALAGRSTVAYASVEATPSGQPFQLIGEPIATKPEEDLGARVELVNGATVWFVVEGLLASPPPP